MTSIHEPSRLLCYGALLAALLAGCAATQTAAPTPGTSAPVSTSTTAAPNPRWAMDHKALKEAELTEAEMQYGGRTALTLGISTNPAKMLEWGYDLCERYTKGGTRAQAIRDWSVETNQPMAVASKLGAAATTYLCPE